MVIFYRKQTIVTYCTIPYTDRNNKQKCMNQINNDHFLHALYINMLWIKTKTISCMIAMLSDRCPCILFPSDRDKHDPKQTK